MPQELSYARVLFRESQSFRQKSLWIIVLAATALPLMFIIFAIYQKPAGPIVWTLSIIGIGTAPLLLAVSGLQTIVTTSTLVLRFFPFRNRKIPISQIASFAVETYHPWREFGGWGIKLSMRNSTWSYTASGDRGVRLQLSSGEKLLIGSQRAEELAEALRQATAPQSSD